MTRCPSLCRRNLAVKEDIEQRKKIGKRIRNMEKADRDKWEWTIEEKFDKEIKLNKEKVRETVLQKKEDFIPKKERTYLMSRQEKEKVQEFMKEQLRKGYIRPSKSP